MIPPILHWAAACILSIAGINPSHAITAFFAPSQALFRAVSTASILLVWPPTIDSVLKSFATTTAFVFTCFAIFHANTMSSIISASGLVLETTLNVSLSSSLLSVSCTSVPNGVMWISCSCIVRMLL